MQSDANPSPRGIPGYQGKQPGILLIGRFIDSLQAQNSLRFRGLLEIPCEIETGNFLW